ncbi:hypothetical protein D3C77_575430 [compost metagenome]
MKKPAVKPEQRAQQAQQSNEGQTVQAGGAPIDRSMHSYNEAYTGAVNSKSDPGWMKWVDIASGVWNKYRS